LDTELACPLCASEGTPAARCDACGGLLEVAGYRLGDSLGRGGSGRVFGGKRVSDGEGVAIKILELSSAEDWKSYDLFARGSQALQTLSHPGLPRVFALEHDAHGRMYQVRERFEGGTLRERVAEQHGLPSAAVARELLIRLLRALQYLHGRLPPIVHRDIKPSNVMFRKPGSWEPVLIDFESIALSQASTGTTIVVSPGYTAPEQLGGRITPQSDLYSLAATFVYACTGKEPDDVLRGPRTAVRLFPGMDAATADVLLQMLVPIPEQRIASASEALRRLQAPDPALAKLVEPSPLARVIKVIVAGGVVVALMFGAVSISGSARKQAFKEAIAGLGLDFARTSDRVIVQSAKGVAADVGVGISDCGVDRHVLRGDSYGSLMQQLDAVKGIDPRKVRSPAGGDVFVVLDCDVAPYPSLPLGTEHISVTFRSAYGVPMN
jgi:hypothetical protein